MGGSGDIVAYQKSIRLHAAQDNDRRKGKGHRFCLGERIYSISCRASYFDYRTILKNRMNSSISFQSSWCNSYYNSNGPVKKS